MMLTVQDVSSLLSFLGEEKKYFVTTSVLPYWQKAFVHESINVIDNYEKLEFLGDVTMGYGFSIYLMLDRGIKDLSDISGFRGYYLSKVYQPIMAERMGFVKFIQHHPKIKLTPDILEDVLEAFFGVITLVSHKLWTKDPTKFSHPVECSRRFFQWYFKTHEVFDPKHGRIVNETFFNQLYYLFSGESTQRQTSWRYDEKTKQMKVAPIFLQVVGYYSKEVEKGLEKIFFQKGKSKAELLSSAVELFLQKGYDRQWNVEENLRISFKEDFPHLNEIAKKNGFLRFILARNEKSSYNFLLQGVDSFTRKSVSHIIHKFNIENVSEIKKRCEDITNRIDFINPKETE